MLFGKKKDATPANPYYNGGNAQTANPTGTQQPSVPAMPQVKNAQDSMVTTTPFPVPLLPTPEPINLPNVQPEPMKTGGGISALDMMKMGTETKSFAFVKLSDFKRILDDIKMLENKIGESQGDLEEFSKVVKEQEEYLNRYATVIRDLRRTIDEISSSLSRVED